MRSFVFASIAALVALGIAASSSSCSRDTGAAPVSDQKTPPPAATPAAAVVAAAPPANAKPTPDVMRQLPSLPLKSPNAEVKQQVGITDVTVKYSSPAVNKRTVWGEVVPFGKVWRAGANSATKLVVGDDVTVGGKPLPAGSYAVFVIPTATTWTFIVNRDPKDAGVFGYDQKDDVLRVDVTPTDAPARERMIFLFEDTTEEGTNLVLDWAGKKMSVPIHVETKKLVQKSIDATMANAWRPPFNVGRYVLESDNDAAKALGFFEKSLAIQETWWNHWWEAQALAKLNRYPDAHAHAEKARTLGKGDTIFEQNFATQVSKSLAEWEKK